MKIVEASSAGRKACRDVRDLQQGRRSASLASRHRHAIARFTRKVLAMFERRPLCQ